MSNKIHFQQEVMEGNLPELPVITNKQGDVVPYVSIKESGIINAYWMPYQLFALLEELFCQRDTEGRWNKAKKYLSQFIPEHAIVVVGKLTKADTMNGKRYKAGSKFRIDSNTRAYNWGIGGSNQIPKDVFVIEFNFPSFDRLKKCYDTYDSINATEKNQEKFYGIITGMCSYEPQSTKVKKGVIITALNMANVCYQPDVYFSKAPVTEAIPGQTFYFLDEIKAFDQLIVNEGSWNQTWTCAALMSFKKYGVNNERLLEGLRRLDGKKADTMPDVWDGMTTIIEEWKTHTFLGEKGTRFSQFEDQVSYCLYYIDQWMKNSKLKRPGNGWKNTASKYKESGISSLEKALNL